MTKFLFFGIIALTGVFLFGGQSRVAAQTVTGSIGNGMVSRGSAARGTIIMDIPSGLHVNSSRPATSMRSRHQSGSAASELKRVRSGIRPDTMGNLASQKFR